MLAYLDDAWPGPFAAQDQSLGRRRRRGQLLVVRMDGRCKVLFGLNPGRLRASGLDQIGEPNQAVRVQDGRQASILLILFPGPAGRSKNSGNMRKYTDGVN